MNIVVIAVFLFFFECVFALESRLGHVELRLDGERESTYLAQYRRPNKPAFGERAQPYPSLIGVSLSSSSAAYNFQLKATPDVWAPGYVTFTHADGREESILPPIVQYRAELKDAVISATIFENGVSMLIFNSTDGKALEIRPKSHIFESMSLDEKIAFQRSETVIFTPKMDSSCGTSGHVFPFATLKQRRNHEHTHEKRAGMPVDIETYGVAPRFQNCYSQQNTTYSARIGFHVDYGTYSYLDPALSTPYVTLAFIGSIIADANVVYSNQLNIALRAHPTATKIMLYPNGTPNQPNVTWNYSPSTGCWPNTTTGLTTFTDYASKIPWQADVTTYALLTRCSDSGGVTSAAWVGTACSSSYKVSVNQISGNTGSSSWLVFAHQLGHNFGASHAFQLGQGNTGGIMDYGDGRYPHGTGWYGFHPTYNQAEVCGKIQNTINNYPKCLIPLSETPSTCGNGIIEEDEDCDPGPNQTSPCCTSSCKFAPGAVCDFKALGGRGTCCSPTCSYQLPSVKCGYQSYCSNGFCKLSGCSYYTNTGFCSFTNCTYGCTVNTGTTCYKFNQLSLTGGNVENGSYCDVGKVCYTGTCVKANSTTTVTIVNSPTLISASTNTIATTFTAVKTMTTLTTTTTVTSKSTSITTSPTITVSTVKTITNFPTTSKTTTISATTNKTSATTTTTNPTPTTTTKTTSTTTTTTTKSMTTTTMPCTVTPLMINDFNSPFVDTNLLGGDNGVSGSGYLEHQRSSSANKIGWVLWKPGKDEYFYMQFYKAILKGKEVCRSFTQYKSLRFLMQRVDDVGGIIKVVFDTGCGPYQSVQAASIYISGWQTLEYRVPLDGLDLSKVRRILFYWKGYSPAKFYVDDIKFGC